MADDYKQLLRNSILDQTAFLRATFSGQRQGEQVPWIKVTIRPVLIKNNEHLQFSYFEKHKNIVKNYSGPEIAEQLAALLLLPFKNYHVDTNKGNIHVQITKKGKVLVHRSKMPNRQKTPNLSHDHQKNRLLPANKPNPFLQSVGIMAKDGKIKANMQSKYRQINEFLKRIDEIIQPKALNPTSFQVVDFGCGNAYLTFAAYHYLNHIVDIPTHLVGVDVKADLVQKHGKNSQALGWTNITFQNTKIIDFQPATPPDIVLALHACDTATDEAIAQGIRMQSQFIFSVPCCHHHLQQQLNKQTSPPEFQSLFRHGILKEHLGDILTDTFRAAILRIMGYKTDVVQFVASEHTPKNLMIRAVKSVKPGDSNFVQEYQNLKNFWQVTPYLEHILTEKLAIFLPSHIIEN